MTDVDTIDRLSWEIKTNPHVCHEAAQALHAARFTSSAAPLMPPCEVPESLLELAIAYRQASARTFTARAALMAGIRMFAEDYARAAIAATRQKRPQ
jgi:hypothetical protein